MSSDLSIEQQRAIAMANARKRQAEASNGLFPRIGQDVQKREAMAQDIMSNYQAGKITKPEEIMQLAGKAGAGLIGDVSGQVLKSGLGVAQGIDQATGGYGQAALTGMANIAGSLPSMGGGTLAQTVPQEIGGLANQYQQFAERNPRAAANIEAATNLALTVPSMVRGGEGMIKSAVDMVKSPIKRSELAKLTSEDLRARGGELFKLADQQGGILKPQFMDDYINEISKIKPQTEQGMALAGENATTKAVAALSQFQGKDLTFQAAKEIDEILGEIAYGSMDNFGKFTADGKKVLELQNILREKIESAADNMFIGGRKAFNTAKEARKYWSASLRLRDIERIVQKAEGAEQPTTVIKNGFRALRDNGKRLKGYTPEEIDAIKKAAKTGIVGQGLKLGGSGLVPIIAGTTGGVATAGMGGFGAAAALPAYLVQQASKTGAEALQMGRANQVANLLKSRALGQELPQTIRGAAGSLVTQAGQSTLPIGAAYLASEQQRQQGPLTQRVMAIIEKRKQSEQPNGQN